MGVGSVEVRLVDLEPIGGLIAACSRLSMAMTVEAYEALPPAAQQAATQIQSILWRLEHSRPETTTPDPAQEV